MQNAFSYLWMMIYSPDSQKNNLKTQFNNYYRYLKGLKLLQHILQLFFLFNSDLNNKWKFFWVMT